MSKETDIELTIPVGLTVWGKEQHEPLLMFLCFPLCRYAPWSLKRTRYLEEFCGELRGVWQDVSGWERDLLRKLFVRARRLQSLSEGLVREMLLSPGWSSAAHPGSHG